MKKIYPVIFLLTIFLCTSAVAEVVTTTRKVVPAQTQQQSYGQTTSKPVVTSRLAENIKTCTPYSESLQSTTLGMVFNFNIRINGWVDNKCEVDFTAKSDGFSSMFQSLYGVDPSAAQVYTYEPVAKCAFTKQQLESVGDSILQEEERKRGGKMLKSPDNIDISKLSNLSDNDRTLMDIIFSQGACSISNGSSNPIDINKLNIFGF